MTPANALPQTAEDRGFFGHPRGLQTLFFTEMWERFSYYGMRALLILFMTAPAVKGGLGFDDQTAAAVYGLYVAAVYLVALPGGWVADRLVGPQKAIWYGGILIMIGHFTLAIPGLSPAAPQLPVFFLGLLFVVLGTGLLKPNISAIVGQLYPAGGARRDAGFSLFYMGINLGAMLGPLVCSYLGENVSWHYGFGAAGVGMFLGLIQYRLTAKALGPVGVGPSSVGDPARDAMLRQRGWQWLAGAVAVLVLMVLLLLAGVIRLDPIPVAHATGVFIVLFALAFFAWILVFGHLTAVERRRVAVIGVFFVASAIFWSGFEQAGSTLNLFADRYTDRSFLGRLFPEGEHPAGYYQSVNALFILLLAPWFGWLWIRLAARMLEPSAPMKFALGLILLASGFAVMAVASVRLLAEAGRVLPTWLIVTYWLHTCGELCLSPIGLSWVTKLSPARYVGQMMGIWFTATSLGNLMSGLIAGYFGKESLEEMPQRFLAMAEWTLLFGLILALFAKPLRRMIGEVK